MKDMTVIWFEQDACHHGDKELEKLYFYSITEADIKAACDNEYDTYTVELEYEDDGVKIFQAIEDDEGESYKFICIRNRS